MEAMGIGWIIYNIELMRVYGEGVNIKDEPTAYILFRLIWLSFSIERFRTVNGA